MMLAATFQLSATTLFLAANDNWVSDGARFAVYTVDDQKWADMTPVSGEKNIFSAVVNEYTTKVVFYRMNPAKKENTTANKWNETNQLSLEINKNLYIMDASAWDKGGGYWSRFEAAPASGSLYLWYGIGSTFKATEKGGDSFVLKTDERVLVGAGMMGNSCLKINGDYTNGYYVGLALKNGGVNAGDTIYLADFRTSTDGTYRLGIEFYDNVDASSAQGQFLTTVDPQVLDKEGAPKQTYYIVPDGIKDATHLRLFRNSGTEAIWIAKLELVKKGSTQPVTPPDPPVVVEDPTITVIGDMTNWESEIPFTLSSDKKTATLVEDKIPAGTYEFKVKVNGEWRSNGQTFDREHNTASGVEGNADANMKLVVDVQGKFTFKWTFATNSIVITFPAKPEDPPVVVDDPTVTVIGSMTEWAEELPFTLSGDKKTATFSDKIPAGEYQFKIKVNGEWRSNGYTFHREFTHADGITMNENDNMVLQADVTGKYTFTWTFETNSINIVFPEKGEEPPVEDKSGYYIVGNHTDWKIDTDYKFEANPNQEGEYVAKMFLTPDYIIKVVYSEDGKNAKTWFPEGEGNAYGENGEITTSGACTLYFRPNKDGGEGWFYGCLYVVVDEQQAIEDLNASEKAVKVIRNGQIIILKGNKQFNILGAQVQ